MDKYQNKYRIPSTRLQNWDYGWNAAYFVTLCTVKRECYIGEIENNQMMLSHIGVIADILWFEIKNHAQNVELDAFVVMPNHIHGIIVLNGFDPDYGDTNCGDGKCGDADGGDAHHGNTHGGDAHRGEIHCGDAHCGGAHCGDIHCGNAHGGDAHCGGAHHGEINVETRHALSLQPHQPHQPHPPQPSPESPESPQSQPSSQSPPSQPLKPSKPSQPTSQPPQFPPPPIQTIGQKRFQNQGKNTLSSIIGAYKSAVTKHAHRLGFDFVWQPRFYDHIIRDDASHRNIQEYIINNPRYWGKDRFYF